MKLIKAEIVNPEYLAPTGVLGKDWHVFDDHVSINENVVERANGTFILKVNPVGTVNVLIVND